MCVREREEGQRERERESSDSKKRPVYLPNLTYTLVCLLLGSYRSLALRIWRLSNATTTTLPYAICLSALQAEHLRPAQPTHTRTHSHSHSHTHTLTARCTFNLTLAPALTSTLTTHNHLSLARLPVVAARSAAYSQSDQPGSG